jgi:hypothetical protein
VWEHFEDIIDPIIIRFLTQPPLQISPRDIKKASSKSVYPDLKVKYQGKLYAIDVKSGEDCMDPWYDMGRLDTYEKKHIDKYEAEYYITVRWTGRNPTRVIAVYIEPAHQSVGYKETYKGVLYRPYDGKIRPKSWEDFKKGKVYWKTKEDFRKGLNAAKMHRRVHYMTEWYDEMTSDQRAGIRKALDSIDKGQHPSKSNDEE